VWFKYVNSDWLFRNLNLRIREGITAIIGPNGSGKTTILRLITGALKPAKGEIIVYGRRIKSIKDSIGLVSLLPSNPVSIVIGPKVRDDIEKACRAFGSRLKNCFDLLEKYYLSEFEDRLVSQLSEGELRLLSLISIVALDTKVILMDEPTVGLDKTYREKLIEILRNECSGKTIIIATNDMRLASNADNVIAIDNGSIVSEGEPREVFYNLKKEWFYSPIVDFVNKLKESITLKDRPVRPKELSRLIEVLLSGS